MLYPETSITVQTGTLSEDFKTMVHSKVLISSTSYFPFWPAFVSPSIQTLIHPNWGVCQEFDYDAFTHCNVVIEPFNNASKLKNLEEFKD